MAITIAISNQKGGVSKTTTALNLGAALAEDGLRVLLIDLDPHTGLSNALGVDVDTLPFSSFHAFMEPDAVKPHDLAQKLALTGLLYLIPGSDELAAVETKIRDDETRDWRLVLAEYLAPLAEDFDYILLDCPGSLGAIAINAFTSARHVIVPVQPEKPAIDALPQLEEQVARIKQRTNPELDYRLLITMRIANRSHHDQGVALLQEEYGDVLFSTAIPHSIRFADSVTKGESLIHYEPSHKGAHAFRALASEVKTLWAKHSR